MRGKENTICSPACFYKLTARISILSFLSSSSWSPYFSFILRSLAWKKQALNFVHTFYPKVQNSSYKDSTLTDCHSAEQCIHVKHLYIYIYTIQLEQKMSQLTGAGTKTHNNQTVKKKTSIFCCTLLPVPPTMEPWFDMKIERKTDFLIWVTCHNNNGFFLVPTLWFKALNNANIAEHV